MARLRFSATEKSSDLHQDARPPPAAMGHPAVLGHIRRTVMRLHPSSLAIRRTPSQVRCWLVAGGKWIRTIGPPPEIVVDPSGSRRDHRAKYGCLSARPRVRCLCPPGKTQHLLPKSVFDRPGSDRWNLASTTFPDAGPMVRIRFPPAESQVRTCLSREFAFLRREAAVSAGVRAGASGAVGRDARGAATSCLRAVISLSGYIPVPHRR